MENPPDSCLYRDRLESHCRDWVTAGRIPARVYDLEAIVSALVAQYDTDPVYYAEHGWSCVWRDLDTCDLVAEGVLDV